MCKHEGGGLLGIRSRVRHFATRHRIEKSMSYDLRLTPALVSLCGLSKRTTLLYYPFQEGVMGGYEEEKICSFLNFFP